MIAVLPYMNLDGKPSSPQRTGLDLLMEDLSAYPEEAMSRPPESVRKNLLHRIDNEPARVETDLEGRILTINPAFSGLCGYSFTEVAGRKPGSFLQGEETESECVEILRSAIASRRAAEVTLTNYHKDGSTYRVAISITPRVNADGKAIGFLALERKVS